MFRICTLLVLLIHATFLCFAQPDDFGAKCKQNFPSQYISDGQEYCAPLKSDQKIEFKTTFFGNNQYRLVACTNITGGDLVFSVFDTDKNLLFSNENYDYSPYWNFSFTSTVTCIIQVDVKQNKFKPGYVMMLIGYKQ